MSAAATHHLCPGCAYDLRGIPEGCCPECGRAFSWEDLQARALAESMRGSISPMAVVVSLLLVLTLVWLFTVPAFPRAGAEFYWSNEGEMLAILHLLASAGICFLFLWPQRAEVFSGER